MAQYLGHEKLNVYQRSIEFAGIGRALLDALTHRVAACDHLERAAESILFNIAHASSSWFPKERIVYLGHANGSALECAACLDILVAKSLLAGENIYSGKCVLSEIVCMLNGMRRITANQVSENRAMYRTKKGNLFGHEDLNVYHTELHLVAWVEKVSTGFSSRADLVSRLDKTTTSIVLNTAEGNGRFTEADHAKFLNIAYKSTLQSLTLVDLVEISGFAGPERLQEGRQLLREIAAMLTALVKVVRIDT
jgi:four helix bundle protein